MIIKNNEIDIAHFQYIAPLYKCCKEIITTHDILFRDFPQLFPFSYRITKDIFFKHSARRADLLFTVSEYSRASLSKYYGINMDDIFITPNAVSDDFYSVPGAEVDAIKDKYHLNKYILYVSRIEPRKNHINLVKAYVNLSLWNQDIKLVFVGKETIPHREYNRFYNNLSKEIQGNIITISQLAYKNLLAIYKGCLLFVYPSIAEGFGIPPLEAATAGVTCLCSKNTAMSDFDFFGDGFFDPLNINELEQKIHDFLNGAFKIDTSSIQSIVHKRYNWNTIADNFLKTIKTKFQY
ncbi:glycosyl transferase [Spirochaetia bacterium]|nr:glycosyl transferase [Spirochaetia bacterium]